MNGFDLIILFAGVAAALGGYRLGFLGRVTSWVGLVAGFVIGVLLVPPVVRDLASSSAGVRLVVVTLLMVGLAMMGQALGLVAGAQLHRALPFGPVRRVDRVVGAGVGAVGVMALLWLLLPSISSVPGWPARATSGSAIARWVARAFPVPPPALQELRRFLAQGAPQVFSDLNTGSAAGPPPAVSPLGAAVTASVAASTVKVEGQACGRIYEGSGFAVAPDLIATNAHVVAGEGRGDTEVLLPSGGQLRATVVMFDSRRDLALLSVRSLGERPLPMRVAHTGAVGAVFGHPEGRDPIVVTPARVSSEETAVGMDLYDTRTTRRDVLVLASALAHGDSGGALVDDTGTVFGVAFAISADHAGTSYALSVTELQAALTQPRDASGASTGSCLTG